MDANGTRFDLLLGRADWARCTDTAFGSGLETLWSSSPPPAEPSRLAWDEARQDLTLRPELLFFQAGASDRPVSLEDRRGAAADCFGNWYWISPDRRAVLVKNAGDKTVRTFWPVASTPTTPPAGAFHPMEPPPRCPVLEFAGLTITTDHHLVVGVVDPPGYLRFDLQGGGPPRRIIWPEDVIAPFDLTPRPRGGFFLLDRVQRRLWEFDRAFQLVSRATSVDPVPEATFVPVEGPELSLPSEIPCLPDRPPRLEDGVALELEDPIAAEALPDGSVLILDRRPGSRLPLLAHYRQGIRAPDPTGLADLLTLLADPVAETFRLEAHDLAVVPVPNSDGALRLYLVSSEGNQAFAFDVSGVDTRLQLHPVAEFLPMRRFGGRALVRVGERAFYDSLENWVPLIEQKRPRYVPEGTLWSPVFDSQTPDCGWHRIVFDGAVPPETRIEIFSRASNDPDELSRLDWWAEPAPLRRVTGSELPWMRAEECADRGTWETLFQRAKGRYAQLQIRLVGNGRLTPRLRALRVYQPRFSYLRQYLPPVYREEPTSASFLERLLANFEGQWTALEDQMAAVQLLFDARTAPPDTLEWLASWFGAVLDPAWDETRRRLFLRHAMTFFAYRGTVRGLHLALRLMFDCRLDEGIFRADLPLQGRLARYRIVERFRQRRSLVRIQPDGSGRWTPELGAADLHQRWWNFLGTTETSVRYPLRRPTSQGEEWAAFSRANLGFIPRAAESDLESWQAFLNQRYSGNLVALNDAQGSNWPDFNVIPLPGDLPSEGDLREDWESFANEVRGPDGTTQEALWNAFLRRRYRNVKFLREAYGALVNSFEDVTLPSELPAEEARVRDWFVFEGVVLPMQETAHRFTVLLPLTTNELPGSPEKRREVLRLADRILRLEKPAHTVFDVRFFWSAFRVGGARLGDDTVLGAGSRSPDWWPGFTLGAEHLSEAFLAARPPRDGTDRLLVGQHRVRRTSHFISSSRRIP